MFERIGGQPWRTACGRTPDKRSRSVKIAKEKAPQEGRQDCQMPEVRGDWDQAVTRHDQDDVELAPRLAQGAISRLSNEIPSVWVSPVAK